MYKVKKLLNGIFTYAKHVPKKAYTSGFIILIGSVVVAFLIIGTNGFEVAGKNGFEVGVRNLDELLTSEDEQVLEMEDIILEEYIELLTEDLNSNAIQNDLIPTDYRSEETEPSTTAKRQEEGNELELHTFNLRATNNAEKILGISSKDYEALTRIVEAEATGEGITGKIMVANVVLNRVEASCFPNNIYDVIHQRIKGRVQFSPIDDGRYHALDVTKSTIEAVERALLGEDYSNGALFFVARALASKKAVSWFDNNLIKVAHYGGHEFFK